METIADAERLSVTTRGWLVLAGVIAVVACWGPLIDRISERRLVRRAQQMVLSGVDERPVGDVLSHHAHLRLDGWTANWSGDDHLVAARLAADRLSDVDQAIPALLGTLRARAAMTPEWAGMAGDRPLAIEIILRLPEGDAPGRVEALRAVEAWAEIRPEAVAEVEKGIDRALAQTGGSLARRHRLTHQDGHAYADAGIHTPLLAGVGMPVRAEEGLRQLVLWQ